MARKWTAYRSSKSVAGVALVELGIFILYENLAAAVACLNRVLAGSSSDVLGALPSMILALAQALETHAADHQCILHRVLERVLVSSWPLLLVMVGTVLSRDAFTPNFNTTRKKDF